MQENNENKQDKADIILDSAEKLMCSERGADITVDMIAKNAGIGKGSVYYYFKSKEEIVDAVIERCYASALREYFNGVAASSGTLEKLKTLFCSLLREEFKDSSKNILLSLHIREDPELHRKMLVTAVKTVSPILTELLEEGVRDGSIKTDAPREAAEMIVAMLTFLLDNTFFPSDSESRERKLRLYAKVLETCLQAGEGSFDFLLGKKPEAKKQEAR